MSAAILSKTWDQHYDRSRSVLSCPDENLVRILATSGRSGALLDFGSGSGRHLPLFLAAGFAPIVATDISERSRRMVVERFGDSPVSTIAPDELSGYGDGSFSVIVAWGVLHYNSRDEARQLLQMFHRLLQSGGILIGTLRSDRDTHLQSNADLPGISVEYYGKDAARSLLGVFAESEIGHMERTLLGDTTQIIAHWFFRCRRP
ncbi:MAG: class I SAM-dependent methyltransferase [Spirochaetales bacterium]|nr:class I SAM-dependent methyltransferase [Spirochaetales bacterium]